MKDLEQRIEKIEERLASMEKTLAGKAKLDHRQRQQLNRNLIAEARLKKKKK